MKKRIVTVRSKFSISRITLKAEKESSLKNPQTSVSSLIHKNCYPWILVLPQYMDCDPLYYQSIYEGYFEMFLKVWSILRLAYYSTWSRVLKTNLELSKIIQLIFTSPISELLLWCRRTLSKLTYNLYCNYF